MTAYRPGDILLIPFPFTDLSTFKQRPCVVISSAKFNSAHNDLIVAAITSHLPEKLDSADYLLNNSERQACDLPKISLIKLGKIVTLDHRLIRKRLGQLPKESVVRIFKQIHKILS